MAEPSNTARPISRGNWIPMLIVLTVVGLLTLPFYWITTLVSGVEFNPGTWQVRSFTFRADPFTGFQFTGIQYDNSLATVDKSITALLDRKSKQENNRWELASIARFNSEQTGPCMVVVQLISGYGIERAKFSQEFWTTWTADQPVKAKEFWPAIQELANNGWYSSIPELLDLPSVELDDQRFQDGLTKIMGRIRQANGQSLKSGSDEPSPLPSTEGLES